MESIKFKDVAHLYMGCEMVRNDGYRWPLLFTDKSYEYSITRSKPALLPLSAMTDEHAKEIGLNDFQTGLMRLGSWFHVYLTSSEFKKCLDLRYDLFNLIPSGEAVDATTLNPNPYA